jgi:hypothetical protein
LSTRKVQVPIVQYYFSSRPILVLKASRLRVADKQGQNIIGILKGPVLAARSRVSAASSNRENRVANRGVLIKPLFTRAVVASSLLPARAHKGVRVQIYGTQKMERLKTLTLLTYCGPHFTCGLVWCFTDIIIVVCLILVSNLSHTLECIVGRVLM